MNNNNKTPFYTKVKTALTYTGFALAIISSISYLILVYILINGFEASYQREQLIGFLILGAIAGVLINLSMRTQGIDFAKQVPEAKKILEDLKEATGESDKKEYKAKSIVFMYFVELAKDILIKGSGIGATLYFAIDLSYKGLGEDKYFFLALANVLLYTGLGLVAMGKSYDYYLEKHTSYMIQKTRKIKEEKQNVNETITKDYVSNGTDGGRRAVKGTREREGIHRGSYSEQSGTNWDHWRFKGWKRNIKKWFNKCA